MWKKVLKGVGRLIVLILICIGILWIATNIAGWIQGPAGPLIEP